jgi:hypothetical protein
MRVTRRAETQWLPIFLLFGLFDAVVLSALDLACDDYIYRALGRLFGIATPFVSFSLLLYLMGGILGLAIYGITRTAQIRFWVDEPITSATVIAACGGFLVGALLLLDLLFVEVFPHFELAAWVVYLVIGLTLLNAFFFGTIFAVLLYFVLRALFPGEGRTSAGRSYSFALVAASALLIMAVFLANDMQVQVEEQRPLSGEARPSSESDSMAVEIQAEPVDLATTMADSSVDPTTESEWVESHE